MKKIDLRKKFIFALLSSWSVTFIGIFYAKYINITSSKTLIYILLISGATTPFQLFFNECIAPAEALKPKNNSKIPGISFFLGIILQSIAITFFLKNISSFFEITLFVSLFSLGSYFSFQYVKYYYISIKGNYINDTQNITLSIIPGITVILVYGAAFCLKSLKINNWESILYLNAILPQLAQFLVFLTFSKKLNSTNYYIKQTYTINNLFESFIYLGLLMVAAIILINSRNEVAKSSTDSMAILIVFLNALGSIVNTLTRASFLSTNDVKKNTNDKFKLIISIIALSSSLFFYFEFRIPLAAMFFALISVSLIIENARRKL
jgi:hypothetical protein